MAAPQVYLAGPMVFARDPDAVFAQMKAICARHGLAGVAPLDNQIGLEGLPPGRDLAERIVAADIALMRRLDGGVFCIDPFRRGVEMDAGTAFEIGYMRALGKPMAGWTTDGRHYPDKVAAWFAARGDVLSAAEPGPTGATSGLLRDPDGVLVHSHGCVQNAMVHVGIEMDGGGVFADPDWQAAFAAAVAAIAARLGGKRNDVAGHALR